jgi:hypothetical protein
VTGLFTLRIQYVGVSRKHINSAIAAAPPCQRHNLAVLRPLHKRLTYLNPTCCILSGFLCTTLQYLPLCCSCHFLCSTPAWASTAGGCSSSSRPTSTGSSTAAAAETKERCRQGCDRQTAAPDRCFHNVGKPQEASDTACSDVCSSRGR